MPVPAVRTDALISSGGSRELVEAIGVELAALQALPARLWLHDAAGGCYYSAAAWDCPREVADLSEARANGGSYLPLQHATAVVGQLEVPAAALRNEALRWLATLLGPLLLRANRQEAIHAELRQVHEEMAQVAIAGELLHHLDVEVLLAKILETVIGAVRAQVGAVLTVEDGGTPQARVCWGLREDHVSAIRLRGGRSVADEVVATGKAMRFDRAAVRERLDLTGLEAHLDALLALPLTARGRIRGVVLLANPERDFSAVQERFAGTLCSLAAAALDNALLVKATVEGERLKQEMALARSVQLGMYPKTGLASEGLWAEGMSRPCTETGGDYYTFLERDGRLVAVIGDVSGHGLGAALFTTMAHAILQQQLRAGVDLRETCLSLNDGLAHTQSGRFMTMAFVEIETATGAMTYVSAGHNPLLWLHAGEVRWLESTGMPLGIQPDEDFAVPPAQHFAPGDVLVLYTDGFTEADDGQGNQYGEERLAAIVRRGWERRLSPQGLIGLISTDVETWSMGQVQADDLTMVVIAAKA